MRLEKMGNKNACVVYADGGTYLVSYNSNVMFVKDDNVTLGKDYGYSHTTKTHVSQFIKEYLNSTIREKIMKLPGNSITEKLHNGIAFNEIGYDENL